MIDQVKNRVLKNLFLYLEEQGISQRRFCRECSLSHSTLRKALESRSVPMKTSTIAQIAEGMGCDPQELLRPV